MHVALILLYHCLGWHVIVFFWFMVVVRLTLLSLKWALEDGMTPLTLSREFAQRRCLGNRFSVSRVSVACLNLWLPQCCGGAFA